MKKKSSIAVAFAIILALSATVPPGTARETERKETGREDYRAGDEEGTTRSYRSKKEHDPMTDAGRMVGAHNEWRALFGVPPLTWSPRLTRYAQRWADFLIREDRFEHRRGSPYGENLAIAMGRALTPDEVVRLWAEERASYDRTSNACVSGEVCGHFTQVVWKHSREVGCGVARKGTREVWVCNYNPPGNVMGRAPY